MGCPLPHHFASFFNLILQVRILQSPEGKLSAFANVGPEDSKPYLWDRTCHAGHGYAWAASASTAAHLCSFLFAKQSYWELCNLVELTLCPSTRKSLLRDWSLGLTADKDKNPATEAEGPAALDTTGRIALAPKARSRVEWPSLTSRYCYHL